MEQYSMLDGNVRGVLVMHPVLSMGAALELATAVVCTTVASWVL